MRILLSTQGTGGDLFPFIGIRNSLAIQGHEVTMLTTPPLSAAARLASVPTRVANHSSSLHGRLALSPDWITEECAGWKSWERAIPVPSISDLRRDVSHIEKVVREVKPHISLLHSLDFAAVAAVRRMDVPWIGVHLYPQFVARDGNAWSNRLVSDQSETTPSFDFASDLREVLKECMPEADSVDAVFQSGISRLGNILLHDPSFLGSDVTQFGPCEAVGYPYWDDLAPNASDFVESQSWLVEGRFSVVASAGSFIGAMSRTLWAEFDACRWPRDWRVVIAGADPETRRRFADHGSVRAVGFVPISKLLKHAKAAIHHGGLGSAYGCLLAGLPSVVIPRAFDQFDNARWLTELGFAVQGSQDQLRKLPELLEALAAGDNYISQLELRDPDVVGVAIGQVVERHGR